MPPGIDAAQNDPALGQSNAVGVGHGVIGGIVKDEERSAREGL